MRWGQEDVGRHTYDVGVYMGRYRIMDHGPMQNRYWANQAGWDQHVPDNIWNDHTGQHWAKKDTSPSGGDHLVNHPGNPSTPGRKWDWRTYSNDIAP